MVVFLNAAHVLTSSDFVRVDESRMQLYIYSIWQKLLVILLPIIPTKKWNTYLHIIILINWKTNVMCQRMIWFPFIYSCRLRSYEYHHKICIVWVPVETYQTFWENNDCRNDKFHYNGTLYIYTPRNLIFMPLH